MPTPFDCSLRPAGVWSALQEIDWTQQAARHCPALRFYVMGFYIHSCPKMTYKARFKPSELLCDRRHCWIPLEAVRGALDVSPAACQHSMLTTGLKNCCAQPACIGLTRYCAQSAALRV